MYNRFEKFYIYNSTNRTNLCPNKIQKNKNKAVILHLKSFKCAEARILTGRVTKNR